VFAITLAFAAAVGIADLVTGGNYMYLRTRPVHNSLLSVMGPWPWYIASTAVLALAMLVVLQLLADVVRRADPRSLAGSDRQLATPVGAAQP